MREKKFSLFLYTAVNMSLKELERQYHKDPKSRKFFPLAEEYAGVGNLEKAVDVLRKGLIIHQSYVGARVALGRILIQLGKSEEARVELEKVIDLVPDNIMAHSLLGKVYEEQGLLEKAAERFRMVLLINPNDEDTKSRLSNIDRQLVVSGKKKPESETEDKESEPGTEFGEKVEEAEISFELPEDKSNATELNLSDVNIEEEVHIGTDDISFDLPDSNDKTLDFDDGPLPAISELLDADQKPISESGYDDYTEIESVQENGKLQSENEDEGPGFEIPDDLEGEMDSGTEDIFGAEPVDDEQSVEEKNDITKPGTAGKNLSGDEVQFDIPDTLDDLGTDEEAVFGVPEIPIAEKKGDTAQIDKRIPAGGGGEEIHFDIPDESEPDESTAQISSALKKPSQKAEKSADEIYFDIPDEIRASMEKSGDDVFGVPAGQESGTEIAEPASGIPGTADEQIVVNETVIEKTGPGDEKIDADIEFDIPDPEVKPAPESGEISFDLPESGREQDEAVITSPASKEVDTVAQETEKTSDSEDAIQTISLARVYLNQGYYERAEEILKAILKKNPLDEDAKSLLKENQNAQEGISGKQISDSGSTPWKETIDGSTRDKLLEALDILLKSVVLIKKERGLPGQ